MPKPSSKYYKLEAERLMDNVSFLKKLHKAAAYDENKIIDEVCLHGNLVDSTLIFKTNVKLKTIEAILLNMECHLMDLSVGKIKE